MQSIRRMGDGYEPHVDQCGNRLTYSLPVDSGFMNYSFTFEICQADLNVLLTDDWRRAILEVIAHKLLQHSTIQGNANFTQSDFDSLIVNTLHSTNDSIQNFITQVSREYHISIERFVEEVINQRSETNQDFENDKTS